MSTTLTAPETRRFAALEEKVAEHIGSFFEAAKALAEIRDSRFYRETHETFEAYCKDRWKMSRSRAYQLIASAEVVETLSTNGRQDLPDSERVARPLTKLPEAERAEAWQAAVDAEPDGPTAETVGAIVAERLGAYADKLEQGESESVAGDCPKGGEHERSQDDDGAFCDKCLEPLEAAPKPEPPPKSNDTRRRFKLLWNFCDHDERILVRAFANDWPLDGDVD